MCVYALCVYRHMYVCCVCVHMFLCVHMCIWGPMSTSGIFLQSTSHFILTPNSFTFWGARFKMTTYEFQGPFSLCHLVQCQIQSWLLWCLLTECLLLRQGLTISTLSLRLLHNQGQLWTPGLCVSISECRDYMYVLPHLAYVMLRIKLGALGLLGEQCSHWSTSPVPVTECFSYFLCCCNQIPWLPLENNVARLLGSWISKWSLGWVSVRQEPGGGTTCWRSFISWCTKSKRKGKGGTRNKLKAHPSDLPSPLRTPQICISSCVAPTLILAFSSKENTGSCPIISVLVTFLSPVSKAV